MITRDNIQEVIGSITPKDKKRINNSYKEYCVIYLSIFNSGYSVNITLTDNYSKYQNVSDNGDAILETNEVIRLINLVSNNY